MSAALDIVFALGAYCPKVKIQNGLSFDIEKMRNKRRTRSTLARGNYGKSLMAHFDKKRLEEKTN